jgi:uncharacterized protein YndB with AHSA1/START domain
MTDLTTTAVVNAPPERVWALISDVRHWPDLLPTTVTSVTAVDVTRPEEPGARYVMEQPRIPRATWTMLEWAPPRRFVWQSAMPGVRTTGTHVVDPTADGGARLTLGIAWTGPLAPLVRLAYGRLTQRYVDIEAGQVKARAEAS